MLLFFWGGGGGAFSRCYLNGSLVIIYIYMFQLTLKDLLSIIGSINTCVPNFSLSPLYTLLLFERFALLLPLLWAYIYCSCLHYL